MTRTGLRWMLACTLIMLLAPPASAQDFGVLESGETVNQGNFKLGAYPLFILPDEGDNVFSLAVAVGYGATDSVDIEGRAAFSEDVTFVGGDVEYWFLKNRPLDLSGRGGFHAGFADGDVGDLFGFDATLIASAPVAERLEVVGALDLAFNSMDVGLDDRDGFTTVHLVPGVEVAISPELDFLAEFGIGVTDRSSNYLGFGIAYYIR